MAVLMIRKLLIGAAVCALVAGAAVAESEPQEDPATEEPDVWTGGDPDFCESCSGEGIVDGSDTETGSDSDEDAGDSDAGESDAGESGSEDGSDTAEDDGAAPETMQDGGTVEVTSTRGATATSSRDSTTCRGNTLAMYCKE